MRAFFGSCHGPCGTNKGLRDFTRQQCQRQIGKEYDRDDPIVSMSLCSEFRAPTHMACTMKTDKCSVKPPVRPTTYYWVSEFWGKCQGTKCGTDRGESTRRVWCKNSKTKKQALVSFCRSNDKPDTKKKCTVKQCPTKPKPPTYSWQKGNWGSCKGSCGHNKGKQTRPISCINKATKQSASFKNCTANKPDRLRACTACPVAPPKPPVTNKNVWVGMGIDSAHCKGECGSTFKFEEFQCLCPNGPKKIFHQISKSETQITNKCFLE